MSLTSILYRVKQAILPAIVQNQLLDDLLGAPTDEMATAEAKIESWSLGGDDIEDGSVAVSEESDVIVMTGPVTWQVDDEIVLAGSMEGNSGRYRVLSVVSSTSLQVDRTFIVSESGLFFARTKPRLIRDAKSLALFPGGWETDTDLRDNLLGEATAIHRLRGTDSGIESEFDRITHSRIQIIDPAKPLLALSTSATISARGSDIGIVGAPLEIGDDFTVAGSTMGSNGRYFVFSNDGTNIIPARRAVNSSAYYTDQISGLEVHFREDRDSQRIYFRIRNLSGATRIVTVEVGEENYRIVDTGINGGDAGDVMTDIGLGIRRTERSSGASNGWSVGDGVVKEGWVQVSDMTYATMTIKVSDDSSTVRTRYGMAGLFPLLSDGTTPTGPIETKFGGFIRTVLRGGVLESPVTIYKDALAGFYLGFGYPGTLENDDYTMASPDDFVVLDVDHRNYRNYSILDIKIAARDHLVPADTEYVIGFV